MAELQRRLHAAVAGECEFVVLAGEPGIGKSRLVEELKNLARARKIRVLSGRFVEHDRNPVICLHWCPGIRDGVAGYFCG